MITIEKTKLDRVLQVTPSGFEDHRGEYIELYNRELYREKGIDIEFIQDDISISSRHVLRGIHGDMETWKLVSCLHGKFYLVVVNCDHASENFGKWESFDLSASNKKQVLIPPQTRQRSLGVVRKSNIPLQTDDVLQSGRTIYI